MEQTINYITKNINTQQRLMNRIWVLLRWARLVKIARMQVDSTIYTNIISYIFYCNIQIMLRVRPSTTYTMLTHKYFLWEQALFNTQFNTIMFIINTSRITYNCMLKFMCLLIVVYNAEFNMQININSLSRFCPSFAVLLNKYYCISILLMSCSE